MTTLHDRLVDLADDVPATAPPAHLWRTGKRRARRTRAAVAGCLVVGAALVGIAGSAVVTRVQSGPPVVGAPTRTELPDRFFSPNGRLPVAHDGTGPLVAVIPAEHITWWGRGEPGLVGVSAVDQRYTFLDLDRWIGNAATGESWSLSPNGRWVAYWYGDRQDDVLGMERAEGLAVLDTSTGSIRKQSLGGELGVSASAIGWTGDAAWLAENEILERSDDGGSSRIVAAWSWDLGGGADQPHEVADPELLLSEVAGPAGVDGFLTQGSEDRWYAVHEAADLSGQPVGRFEVPGPYLLETVTLSPDGRTLALSRTGESGNEASIFTGVVAGDDTSLAELSADVGPYPRVLGWLDADTLAVQAYRDSQRALVSVEVESGRTRTLASFEQAANDGTQLATDLLGSPVVSADEPPRPWHPLKVAATTVLLALALWAVSLAVRRRRARR